MSQLSGKAKQETPEEDEVEGTVGERVNSKYGRRLVKGAGEFVDDVNKPGMLHAEFVRSPFGHAKIHDIDTTEAEAMQGVEFVWTAEDIEPYISEFGHPTLEIPDNQALSSDRVRCVGDEVALVVATDKNTAEEATDLVDVDYERLDAVTTCESALADDAPLVHPELDETSDSDVTGNLLYEKTWNVGDVDDAFERADVVVSESFKTNQTTPSPLEPHGIVAEYHNGDHKMDIWSSNQAPQTLPENLAKVLEDFDADDIRARMPDVGGAFGVKGGHEVYTHEVCAPVVSMVTERPVKIVHDRMDSFKVGGTRAAEKLEARVAATEDGDLIGWDVKMKQNTGAYASYGIPVAMSGASCGAGPLLIPNQRNEFAVVYTNAMYTTAVRGFGDPQYAFMRGQLVDMLADELDMDATDIFRKNVPNKEDMPMRSPTGLKWYPTDLHECIDSVCDMINWDEHRGGYVTKNGDLRGIGMGLVMRRCASKVYGTDYESAIVRISKSGGVIVYSGIATVGQGTETALCQIVADELGVSVDRVEPVVGDSEMTPEGMGVWADRGTILGGSAASKAAKNLRKKIVRLAAYKLDVGEDDVVLADERIYEDGNPDNGMGIDEFIDRAVFDEQEDRPEDMQGGVSLIGEAKFESQEEEGLDEETGTGNISHTYSFGALATLVEVNPGTGEVEVIDVAAAEDAGTIINPKLAEGQTQGGAVQALGEVLQEKYHYTDNGNLTNGNYIDYHVPTAADVPMITKIDSIESYDPTTSNGQRGVGEFSIVPVGAAVANAVYDATGLRFTELPLSPDRVLPELIEEGMAEIK